MPVKSGTPEQVMIYCRSFVYFFVARCLLANNAIILLGCVGFSFFPPFMSIFFFFLFAHHFFIIFPRGFISLGSQISLRRRRRAIPRVAETTRLVIYVSIYSLLLEFAAQGVSLEFPHSFTAKTFFCSRNEKTYELFGSKKSVWIIWGQKNVWIL